MRDGMDDLRIEYLSIEKLKPYKGNARKHGDEDVEAIRRSIEAFGFDDPIGIWGPDNIVVEGHGRLLAARKIGMASVPVIRLDHLSDDERKAYALAHNRTAELSAWDAKALAAELEALPELDMADFGFDTERIQEEWEEQHEKNKEDERFADANILNLERAQFDGVGKYDIPEILPTKEIPEVKEWIGFNYVLSDKHPEGKGVHFFLNDYQFERIWNNPNAYVEKLKRYEAVASPDFSPYGDMPLCLQIYNHYRKHWVARFLQSAGIRVVATIRCSTDPRSLAWYLDGEPKNSPVIISSMWTSTEEEKAAFAKEYNTMLKKLKPSKIWVYGKDIDGLGGNVERIKTFTETRWN